VGAHAERPEEQELVEPDDVLDERSGVPLGARRGASPRLVRYALDRAREAAHGGAVARHRPSGFSTLSHVT
jgi:hypothetical protein